MNGFQQAKESGKNDWVPGARNQSKMSKVRALHSSVSLFWLNSIFCKGFFPYDTAKSQNSSFFAKVLVHWIVFPIDKLRRSAAFFQLRQKQKIKRSDVGMLTPSGKANKGRDWKPRAASREGKASAETNTNDRSAGSNGDALSKRMGNVLRGWQQ